MNGTPKWLRHLLWPPTNVPGYDVVNFMSQDQLELDRGWLLPLSPDALEKGQAATAEKYNELREEASRLVERELKLIENAQKLHANAVQFGLAGAGIVASLGAWFNLMFVAFPLIAFVLSISTAWWFLCKEPPDWQIVMRAWGEGLNTVVDENKRFRKEMFLHLYERLYFAVLRDYRSWLHSRLAIPASLFIVGLVLLLICVAISR